MCVCLSEGMCVSVCVYEYVYLCAFVCVCLSVDSIASAVVFIVLSAELIGIEWVLLYSHFSIEATGV